MHHILMMRTLLISLILTGCQLPKPHSPVSFKTVSLELDYKKYLQESKNGDLNQQTAFWDLYILNPHRQLVEKTSRHYKNRKNGIWKSLIQTKINEFHPLALKSQEATFKMFKQIPESLTIEINTLKKNLPETTPFELTLYLVPSFQTYNAGSHALIRQKNSNWDLYMAPDTLVFNQIDISILISHELFHLEHNRRLALPKENLVESAQLSLTLFMEGIATYYSWHTHQDKKMSDYFFSGKFAHLTHKDLPSLAKSFLKIAHKKSYTSNQSSFRQWFFRGQNHPKYGVDEIGYWLGFQVLKKMSQKYTIQEMIDWKPDRIHQEVVKTLVSMSANKYE